MAETIEKTETIAVEQKSNMEDSFAKRVEELDAKKSPSPIPPLNTVKETVDVLNKNGTGKEKENGQEKQNITSPTEEQKKIETLKIEKEKIQNDLKLTQEQKAEAVKKLENTQKDPQWWERTTLSENKEPITDESKNKE